MCVRDAGRRKGGLTMREILFRGKRVKNNEWVYGSFLKQAGERISKDEVAPI